MDYFKCKECEGHVKVKTELLELVKVLLQSQNELLKYLDDEKVSGVNVKK
jgi:hypothetical protein